MSALITVHNGDHITGQCDAKCYLATGKECNCVCGGANHGVGLKQATANTRQLADIWAEQQSEKHPGTTARINPDILQLGLFD